MANINRFTSYGSELTGNASSSDVVKGKTFYNNNDEQKLTGTLELTGNTNETQVLSGYKFYSNDPKNQKVGTMPNKGNVNLTLKCGGSYTIPKGYHAGGGVIRANSVRTVELANSGVGTYYSAVLHSSSIKYSIMCNGGNGTDYAIYVEGSHNNSQWYQVDSAVNGMHKVNKYNSAYSYYRLKLKCNYVHYNALGVIVSME